MHENERPRPRLLMLAYYCQPDRGSEYGIGWNHAVQCAQHFDTWVISRGHDNAIQIGKFLQANDQIPGLHFEFIGCPKWEDRLLDVPLLKWLVVRRWHRRALFAARQLHKTLNFDLVHQVTCNAYREPGYLWKLDLPFVWGPVGGADNVPWRFLLEGGFVNATCEALRNLANTAQMRWSRRVKAAGRKASAVLFANSTIREQFQRAHGLSGGLMLDTSIRQLDKSPHELRADAGPLRILWSGALESRKALSLLLKALTALPSDAPFRLRVLGEGTMEHRWKRLAAKLGIDSHVEWTGWLSHEEALGQYRGADVFVFTSLRDTSGTVVLEALANGLPVVCLDHQGAHDVVTERCGIKVPVKSPRQVVSDLRDAIVRLARDSEVRAAMSEAAMERAPDYLWTRQGALMRDVYHKVLAGRDGGLGGDGRACEPSCPGLTSAQNGAGSHATEAKVGATFQMGLAEIAQAVRWSGASLPGNAVREPSSSRKALSQS